MEDFTNLSQYMPSDIAKVYDNRLKFLNSALLVAECAGKTISEAYYKTKTIYSKECESDLVTETDKAVEKYIFDTLRSEYPSHCFIGEESVGDSGSIRLTSAPTWIVDPIDGTTNFVHQCPYVAVSIGLLIEKKVEVGVVYAPILGDWYVGLRGYGAFINKKRMKIQNPPTSLASSLVVSEWGATRTPNIVESKGQNFINTLIKYQFHGVRSFGSAALDMCLVAQGSVDIYFEWGPHCWDVAAASLIVEESGGVNTTVKGEPFDVMCGSIISSCSESLINDLVASLTDVPTIRDDRLSFR